MDALINKIILLLRSSVSQVSSGPVSLETLDNIL